MIKKAINQNDSFILELLNSIGCNNIFSNKPINLFNVSANNLKKESEKGKGSTTKSKTKTYAEMVKEDKEIQYLQKEIQN